jgi:hypothetical protein
MKRHRSTYVMHQGASRQRCSCEYLLPLLAYCFREGIFLRCFTTRSTPYFSFISCTSWLNGGVLRLTACRLLRDRLICQGFKLPRFPTAHTHAKQKLNFGDSPKVHIPPSLTLPYPISEFGKYLEKCQNAENCSQAPQHKLIKWLRTMPRPLAQQMLCSSLLIRSPKEQCL